MPRPNRPLHRQRIHHARIQLRVVLRSVGAALRDDADLGRGAGGPLLRGPHQRADRARSVAAWRSSPARRPVPACHSGAEITDNSRRILFGAVVDGVKQPAELVERMFNGECEVVAYDQGIYNIGVRPTEEDLGMGNNDPFGNPLAFIKLLTLPAEPDSAQELLTYPIPNIADPPIAIGERTVTDGTFKVPEPAQPRVDRAVLPQRRATNHPPGGGVLQPRRRLPRAQRAEHRLRDRQAQPDRTGDRRPGGVSRPAADGSARRAASAPRSTIRSCSSPNGHRMQGNRPRVTDEGVARDILLEIPAVGRHGGPLPAGFLRLRASLARVPLCRSTRGSEFEPIGPIALVLLGRRRPDARDPRRGRSGTPACDDRPCPRIRRSRPT